MKPSRNSGHTLPLLKLNATMQSEGWACWPSNATLLNVLCLGALTRPQAQAHCLAPASFFCFFLLLLPSP